MKRIYICSRFKGDTKKHRERAKQFSQIVYSKGYLPVCVHLFLDESTGLSELSGNRERLLELGKEFVGMCDEIWVLDVDGISEGMLDEIYYAKKRGIPSKIFTKMEVQENA